MGELTVSADRTIETASGVSINNIKLPTRYFMNRFFLVKEHNVSLYQ